MTAILILLALTTTGHAAGVYLGEFKSPSACQQAMPKVAEALKDSPVMAEFQSARLMCIPKREA